MAKPMRRNYSPEMLAEYNRANRLFGISMMVMAACLLPGIIWFSDIQSGVRWPVYLCAFILCMGLVPTVFAHIHYWRFRRLLREQDTADAGRGAA